MTDRRERVARAISEEFGNSIWTEWFGEADAAIDAMGLPTRGAVERAVFDFATEATLYDGMNTEQGRAMQAARQRLLDMIPMTEVE